MARQVLTYPDVPDFLTQSEADALYAPASGGAYLTQATADPLYVNVAGDTMSGALAITFGGTTLTNTWKANTSIRLFFQRNADTNPRMSLLEGSLGFGPGTAASDVVLSRASAGLCNLTATLQPSSGSAYDLGSFNNHWRALWADDAEFTNPPTVGGAPLLTQTTADAVFLTPAEGNAAYATAGHNHDATYVNVGGDTMTGALTVSTAGAAGFLVTSTGHASTALRGPDASDRYYDFLSPTDLIRWRWGVVGGTNDLTFWRYNASGGYIGENLKLVKSDGRMILTGNQGVKTDPGTAWASDRAVIRLGASGSVHGATSGEGDIDIGKNVYWDGTNNRAIVAGSATLIHQTSDFWDFYAAPSAAAGAVLDLQPRARIGGDGMFLSFQPGCGLTMHDRQSGSAKQWSMYGDSGQVKWFSTERNDNPMWLTPNGTLIVNPAATSNVLQFWTGQGTFAINSPSVGIARLSTDNGVTLEMNASGALSLVSPSSLWLNYNTYAHPTSDNLMHWGHGSYRFVAVYAVNGTIQTSSIKYKDPLGDLDPEAALAAVLRTPARRFKYKGSERVQSGYYMEEADPLFSIGPDEATPSNDAGILIAAVQALAARIGVTA